MLAKDLRLARRSPAVMALLVAYPILVALLVGLALQADDRRPAVAFVNLDSSGRTVEVGDRRLSVDDYVARLESQVDLRRLGPEEAADALDAGRVTAVLTLPDDFIADLQSGVRQPVVRVTTSRRNPVAADVLSRRLESAVFRLNERLATGYVDQVLRLVDLVVSGGEIGVFGRTGDALGLIRSRALVDRVQRQLRDDGRAEVAADLEPLVGFIDETKRNLDLARPAANAIRAPIRLRIEDGPGGREPISAFGLSGALLVSLGLAGVLLAAAGVSSEREDNVLARLARGLVSPRALVAEKMAFTAAAVIVIGLVLLGAVAAGTSLSIGRWGAWLGALAVAGLAFGAFGALAGALCRETRSAVLAGLMIALPLLALSLLPDDPAASAVSALVPFGPAFDVFQRLLVDPDLSDRVAVSVGHLALVALVFGALAAVGLRHRAKT